MLVHSVPSSWIPGFLAAAAAVGRRSRAVCGEAASQLIKMDQGEACGGCETKDVRVAGTRLQSDGAS